MIDIILFAKYEFVISFCCRLAPLVISDNDVSAIGNSIHICIYVYLLKIQ